MAAVVATHQNHPLPRGDGSRQLLQHEQGSNIIRKRQYVVGTISSSSTTSTSTTSSLSSSSSSSPSSSSSSSSEASSSSDTPSTTSSSSYRSSSSNDNDQLRWIPPSSYYWKQCDTIHLSWYSATTGTGPYNITAVQWPDNDVETSEQAIAFSIAAYVPAPNYDWQVRVPGGSRLSIDVVDVGNGKRASSLLGLDVINAIADGFSSCNVYMSDAVAANAKQAAGLTTNTTGATATPVNNAANLSGANGNGYSETRTTVYGGSDPTSSDHASITYYNGDQAKLLIGLKVCTALLAFAVAVLAFLYYRARKQIENLRRSQSKVGRWINHHNHHDEQTREKDGQQRQRQERFGELTIDTSNVPPLPDKASRTASSVSGKSFFSPNTGSDTFFATRTVSKDGNKGYTSARGQGSSSALSSPGAPPTRGFERQASSSRDTAEMLRPPRKAYLEDVITRLSRSDTHVSDGTNVPGSRASSVIHSDIASTVGGVSAASDEYYHRRPAYTITSPTNTATPSSDKSSSSWKQFLNPSSMSRR